MDLILEIIRSGIVGFVLILLIFKAGSITCRASGSTHLTDCDIFVDNHYYDCIAYYTLEATKQTQGAITHTNTVSETIDRIDLTDEDESNDGAFTDPEVSIQISSSPGTSTGPGTYDFQMKTKLEIYKDGAYWTSVTDQSDFLSKPII